MSGRVLIVEDDPQVGAELVRQLERAGFATRWLRDGDAAQDALLDDVDLVLLDLMLPGTYGMDVLRELRRRSDVPVILLTARAHNADKVRGLTLGADDYVTKPFWPAELLARVHARLRRSGASAGDDTIRVGRLHIDPRDRSVTLGGERVALRPTELALLESLARRAGRAVARSTLVEEALDAGNERTLDVHVSRLRRKLGERGPRIDTVWGIGYRLREDEP
ncbi:MAG: response regulator transcription factor [Myxococcales bacterium]|nr:response regulator transcription factor [Myxococcales bacterium]